MKTFSITLTGINYNIRIGIRTLLAYEQMTGKNCNTISSMNSLNDMINLLYAALYAAGYNKNYDEFLIELDDDQAAFNQFVEEITKPEPEKK